MRDDDDGYGDDDGVGDDWHDDNEDCWIKIELLIDNKYTLIKEKRSIIAIQSSPYVLFGQSMYPRKYSNLKAESTQMDICMFVAYRSARAISFKAFHLFPTVALFMFCWAAT